MDQSSYINTDPLITSEDVAELNRKMAKRALRNLLIIYSINRWVRSLDGKN